jgi:hypothetical protein
MQGVYRNSLIKEVYVIVHTVIIDFSTRATGDS